MLSSVCTGRIKEKNPDATENKVLGESEETGLNHSVVLLQDHK